MSSRARITIATSMLAGSLVSPLAGEGPVEPPWGLPDALLGALARRADAYAERAPELAFAETTLSVRYRSLRTAVPEPTAGALPEFRFEVRQLGPVRRRVTRRTRAFPSAHDWAGLFSSQNQPYFMYRELGTRIEDFDLVREIQFRGWLPFTDGHDIREWEGTALVETTRLQLVEVRARPRNEDARLAELYDRWSRSFKISLGISFGPWFLPIKTFRLARRPFAYRCLARFDHRRDG